MKKNICTHPFYYAEIQPNGDVLGCCPPFCKNYVFGNLHENNLEEIWNSPQANSFREKILRGDYSHCNLSICRGNALETKDYVLQRYYKNSTIKLPEMITLSFDKECNVACIMCRNTLYRNSAEDEIRISNLSQKFLPYLKNCQQVFMSGGGDPFGSRYNRKLIKEICTTYPDVRFHFITNGVLLTEKMYERLHLKNRVVGVYISFHAATEQTYNKIVKYGNFKHLLNNLAWISEKKNVAKLGLFC